MEERVVRQTRNTHVRGNCEWKKNRLVYRKTTTHTKENQNNNTNRGTTQASTYSENETKSSWSIYV